MGTFSEVAAALASAGYEVDDPEGSDFVQCPPLGIGLWREDAEEDRLDSVSAWGPGLKPGLS